MPYEVDNSGTYGLLADLNMWLGITLAWAYGGTADAGWQSCAPAAHAIFTTTYVFAGLAKLNSDYVDVRKSACTVFTLFVGEGFVPHGLTRYVLTTLGDTLVLHLLHLMLILLELVELAIPLLLMGLTSRYTASTVLWAFHLLLGSIAYDYSVISVASVLLIAPIEALPNLAWMSVTVEARVVGVGLCLVCCLRMQWKRCRELASPEHVASLLWLGCLHPSLWMVDLKEHGAGTTAAASPPSLSAWSTVPLPIAVCGCVLVLLTLLNGFGPYLGYKTVGVWPSSPTFHLWHLDDLPDCIPAYVPVYVP